MLSHASLSFTWGGDEQNPKDRYETQELVGAPRFLDCMGTNLQVEVAFLKVVVVPPGELQGFCTVRLWGMA